MSSLPDFIVDANLCPRYCAAAPDPVFLPPILLSAQDRGFGVSVCGGLVVTVHFRIGVSAVSNSINYNFVVEREKEMQVQIPINNVNNGMAMMSPPSGSYNDMTQSLEMAPQHGNEDNRMYNNDLRKFAKNMKPAVLLKSWQRICMLVAGIEAVQSCGNVGVAALEKEIYDRYHGNMHRDPPIIG